VADYGISDGVGLPEYLLVPCRLLEMLPVKSTTAKKLLTFTFCLQ